MVSVGIIFFLLQTFEKKEMSNAMLLFQCLACWKQFLHRSSRRRHCIAVHHPNCTDADGLTPIPPQCLASSLEKVRLQQMNRRQRELLNRSSSKKPLPVGTSVVLARPRFRQIASAQVTELAAVCLVSNRPGPVVSQFSANLEEKWSPFTLEDQAAQGLDQGVLPGIIFVAPISDDP